MCDYQPPFTITNEILSYVSSISEKIGRITATNNLEAKPHLRKNNRIRSIHSSLKIEANSLSLGQVRDVINGKTEEPEQPETEEPETEEPEAPEPGLYVMVNVGISSSCKAKASNPPSGIAVITRTIERKIEKIRFKPEPSSASLKKQIYTY